jgi:uncharacterized protein YjiS (DUF1127 family)
MSHNATAVLAGSRQNVSRPRLRGMIRRLAPMWDAWRTRSILTDMNPWQLKDIGISRAEAQTEIARAPWDIEPRR